MYFPHKKLIGKIGSNKIEKATPRLMPLVKSQLQLAIVRKGRGSGMNLAGNTIDC
jgi:hypothetical protein